MSNLFKTNEPDTTQIDFAKKYEKDIPKFCKTENDLAIQHGKNMANAKLIPENVEVENLAESVRIKNSHSAKISEVRETAQGLITNFQADHIEADKKVKELEAKGTSDLKNDKKELQGELKSNTSDRETKLKEDRAKEEQALKQKKLDQESRKKHNLFWPCVTCIALMILDGAMETGFTSAAFSTAGLGYYEKILTSAGVSVSTILCGLGLVWVSRQKKVQVVWRVLGVTGLFGLICGVYYAIGKLRVSLIQKNIASTGAKFANMTAFDFLLISLIFFIGIIFIDILFWPSAKKFKQNRAYREGAKQIKKSEKKIRDIDDELKKLNKQKRTDISVTTKGYDKAKKIFNDDLEDWKRKRDQSIKLHANCYSRYVVFYDQLNAHHKSMIGLLISTFNNYQDKVFLTIPNKISDLPDPYKDFTHIVNPNEAKKETETIQKSKPTDKMETENPNDKDVEIDFDFSEIEELLNNNNHQ